MQSIEVDQMLFGYDKGHSLLASSINLRKEERWLLLIQSDLSGPSVAAGFYEYYSGFPVPNTAKYAFCKTWYAHEMKRPGSVWTHILLFDIDADIEKLDLNIIAKFFARPEQDNDFSYYKKAISINYNDFAGVDLYDKKNTYDEMIYQLFQYLFEHPKYPIIIPASNASEYEFPILYIWSNLWGKLKGSLSFCTGSISSKEISGTPFDIQVVPKKNLRIIQRKVERAIVFPAVDSQSPAKVGISNDWGFLETAPQTQMFFDFINMFGQKEANQRELAKQYLKIYKRIVLNDKEAVDDVATEIGIRFPDINQERKLKAALFGPESNPHYIDEWTLPNSKRLLQLLTIKPDEAFDSKYLKIWQRARDIWNSEREVALRIIKTTNIGKSNQLASEFVNSIAYSLTPNTFIELYNQDPHHVLWALKKNQDLLSNATIWSGNEDLMMDALEAVKDKDILNQLDKDSLIEAIFSSKFALLVADEIFDLFKYKAVDYIVNAREESLPKYNEWINYLRKQEEYLVDWLNNKIEQDLALASKVFISLPIRPSSFAQIGITNLDLIYKHEEQVGTLQNLNGLSSQYLAFALTSSDAFAPKLVEISFKTIFNALEMNELRYEDWARFQKSLPRLSIWDRRDKKERLIRGVVDKFVVENWPIEIFLKIFNSRILFEKAVNHLVINQQGEQYFFSLIQQVRERSKIASSSQLATINRLKGFSA